MSTWTNDSGSMRVVRSLRRVNLQGSIFGQTVAIRLRPVRVGHRRARAADRHRRRDGRPAVRGHGPDDRRGHARHRPPRAGRLRPAHDRSGRPPAGRRRGRPRAGRDGPVAARVARARVAPRRSAATPTSSSALINDFLSRMADLTQTEATRLRDRREGDPSEPTGPSEHAAPLGGLDGRAAARSGRARRTSGSRAGRAPADLYRARFDGRDARRSACATGASSSSTAACPFDWRKRVAHDRRSTRRSRGRSRSSAASTASRPTCATSTSGRSS